MSPADDQRKLGWVQTLTSCGDQSEAVCGQAFSDEESPRLAFECAPTGLAILSASGQVIHSNRAFDDLLQRAAEGLLFPDLLHPDDRPQALRLLGAEDDRAELRLVLPSGIRWVLAGVAAGPSPHALVLSLTDIHGQKERCDDLAMRESRWNDALVYSGLGVWDQNYRTGVMYYSETWRTIRGLAPDEELAAGLDNWILLVHPDDRDHVLHAIARQNAGDPEYATFQYRERHKDGHWVWIECRGAAAEWDADGNPTRIVGTDTDVTARKFAEEMLARVSRRLELALSISKVGVFEAYLEEQKVEWDEGLLKMFGMKGTPTTKPGDLWETLLHPEDREQAVACVVANLNSDAEFRNDYRVVLADGTVRHIRSRNVAFNDNGGKRRLVGANWDVTADVKLREELERSKTLAEARNVELEMTRARIEHNALHDYLTGLPNRRYLDEVLESQAVYCREHGTGMVIFHIDLDRFKQINDTLGHRAGDMMLQHAAAVLKNNLRTDDFVARIGGDEFVLLTRLDGSQRKLVTLADRIIKELCKPVAYEGHTIRFGASIGIASGSGAGLDAKQLLLNADIALYRAKNRGRNRHEFFSLETQNQIIRNKQVADEILHGLEQDQFEPYYQPQFSAVTLDVTGVETLVRWIHPENGVLSPDKFLPIAEDLDVVSTIDGLILEKALRHLRAWTRKGLGVPKISVNVSSRRLNDPALLKKLRRLKIQPGTVSFELLESIFLDNCDDGVVDNLARLRQLGIDIEIDDFGTGHASIVGLLRISPKSLKIDRELVKLVPSSAEQRKLVGSIIEIGRSLNIKVIAEGVETGDHIRILRDLGCDMLQGYALARPMPFEAIEPFLRAQSWRGGENAVHLLQSKVRRAAKP